VSGQRKYLERATANYSKQLQALRPGTDDVGVIEYLRQHAITYAISEKYRLGYVGTPLAGDEQFTGALAIPYLSRAGVVSIKFRLLTGDAKFLYHEGTKGRLYNTEAYFKTDNAIGITEGEIDAIVATEVVGLPSIGVPGATTWNAMSDIWGPVFSDNYEHVIIFADGDPVNELTGLRAGAEFAKDVRRTLGWRAQIVWCPEGEDVSSMVFSGRADELKERVRKLESEL